MVAVVRTDGDEVEEGPTVLVTSLLTDSTETSDTVDVVEKWVVIGWVGEEDKIENVGNAVCV